MITKTISSSELKNSLADALDSVSTRDIIIVTRSGKKELAIIDLDKLEDLMATSDRAYLQKIKSARRSKPHISHEDAFKDI